MRKLESKEIPWEKQKEILIERSALKLPLLYQNLIATYGDEKGKQMYEEIFETTFKKRAAVFKKKGIVDVMMAEIDIFPAVGWDIWIGIDEEDGKSVCYEHIRSCPHLNATRKHKLPDPCSIICDLDCKMGEKYKVGKWERLSHIPSGGDECCFKIIEVETATN